MRILGISAFYHDSAAALVEDGRIVAAAEEERFTRKKHDAGFPRNAISYCLSEGGTGLEAIDCVAFYKKTFAQLDILVSQLEFLSSGFDWRERLFFVEHQLSLAAAAFFPSPFQESAVLVMDGVGEAITTSLATGGGNKMEVFKELRSPNSLGLLYSAFADYAGFKVNSGEHKVMGLAPYGEPKYAKLILDNIVEFAPDGSFGLDPSYFDLSDGSVKAGHRIADLFGQPARMPDQPLTRFHMDIAASVQAVTEDVVLRLTRALAAKTGCENLCLGGGVALNCVANGKVLRDGRFKNIWIQPAAGEAGGALGAALAGYHMFLDQPRIADGRNDLMRGSYLGPAYATDEVVKRLAAAGARFKVLSDEILSAAVSALFEGKAVGWVQGRMEFGPRALGARSILADPRSPSMQKTLNQKVKYREPFRPFAPSVLREDLSEWFDLETDSPYMLLVAPVREGRDIPAVTHVDRSARVQTVHAGTNPRFHALLTRFKEKTGCPVLVNTSFNVRGEPIVNTPEDAFRCFMGTEIEVLIVENCLLLKEEQNAALKADYKGKFEMD